MKKSIIANIIILIVVLLPALSAFAQGGQVRERLQGELERTEEILIRARELVQNTRSSQAKLAYDEARRLQEMAQDHFRQGPGGQHWEMASKMTVQARQRAQTAMSAARASEQNETALLRLLERSDEMMQRVRDALAGTENQGFQALYQNAGRNLDRAWEFYREGKFRAALKLTKQVERVAEKLLQAVNRDQIGEENFQRRRENVRETMLRLQERLEGCESESARQVLEQARSALQTAERFNNEGNTPAALNALQQAYNLALQAGRQCGGSVNLNVRYDRLASLADHLAEEVSIGDDQARRLLDQAREQLRLARAYIDDEQSQAAAAALKAAQLAINELQRYLENDSK